MSISSNKPFKVLVLTIGNGINILINFLSLPYLVRTLSYFDYGSYGQVLIVISVIQGIFTFNLNQVANIYLARYTDKSSTVFKTILRSCISMSLVGGLLFLLLIPLISQSFSNPSLNNLLYLSILNFIGQVPVPVLLAVLIFNGKVKSSASILIVTNILKISAIYISINFFHSINYLMIGLSLVSVLQAALLFFAIPAHLRRGGSFDKKLAKEVFIVAAPLAITSIIEKSVIYIDGVMISTMLNTTDYAIYRAGALEVPFISTLYGSVAAIIMPEVAKLFAGNKLQEIVELKRKVISTTAFFVYPILVYLLFFALPIVSFYLSSKYVASAMVFAIFNLSLLIRINDYQDIIVVSGNSRFIFFSVIVLTFVNIALNYVLISIFGITGSAVAFILHLILLASMLTYKTTQIMSCSVFDIFDVKKILKIIFVSFFIAFPIWFIYYYFVTYVLFIIICSPIYLILFLLVGLKLDLIDKTLYDQIKSRFIKNKNLAL